MSLEEAFGFYLGLWILNKHTCTVPVLCTACLWPSPIPLYLFCLAVCVYSWSWVMVHILTDLHRQQVQRPSWWFLGLLCGGSLPLKLPLISLKWKVQHKNSGSTCKSWSTLFLWFIYKKNKTKLNFCTLSHCTLTEFLEISLVPNDRQWPQGLMYPTFPKKHKW